MSADRIRYLLEQYLSDRASTQEQQELTDIIQQPENESLLKGHMEQLIDRYQSPEFDTRRLADMVKNVLSTDTGSQAPKVRSMYDLKRWMVAASVLLMIGLGAYFVFTRTAEHEKVSEAVPVKDAKPPEEVRAMITLADGSRVVLDSLSSGLLAKQGNVKLVKLADGQIAYETKDAEGMQMQFNTLSNPRGSRVIQVALSDGTKVWLNAGSSMRYPTVFTGKERKIEITGEAYFEVAHNAARPFKVIKNAMELTVLGTHFNVNAYDDEHAINITLFEGSIKISNSGQSTIVKPGEQAFIINDGQPEVTASDNLDAVIAWKVGKFYFNSADITQIMNQLSRWYNLDVEYKDQIASHFTGIISRDVNASEVFRMLEQTGSIHLNIEGTKIVVRR